MNGMEENFYEKKIILKIKDLKRDSIILERKRGKEEKTDNIFMHLDFHKWYIEIHTFCYYEK